MKNEIDDQDYAKAIAMGENYGSVMLSPQKIFQDLETERKSEAVKLYMMRTKRSAISFEALTEIQREYYMKEADRLLCIERQEATKKIFGGESR